MRFRWPPGATPIDPNEAEGLLPSHIALQRELNEWEETNILAAREWAFRRRHGDLLTEGFVRRIHREMFKDTWRWAGTYRRRDKNLGVSWHGIPEEVRKLCDDARYWIEHRTWPEVEIAVRFHHRLVSIHPFPNGNGRHARLMADLVMRELKQPPLTWGRLNLTAPEAARRAYLEALHAADVQDLDPLLAFARS